MSWDWNRPRRMNRDEALRLAFERCLYQGLDDDTADAAARCAMLVFHEELTEREWTELVDLEAQRHAQP